MDISTFRGFLSLVHVSFAVLCCNPLLTHAAILNSTITAGLLYRKQLLRIKSYHELADYMKETIMSNYARSSRGSLRGILSIETQEPRQSDGF